jgi:H+/Cl- antiporter ClcA
VTSPRALLRDQLDHVAFLVRWSLLGAASGVLAGLASAAFLVTLDWATETREDTPWLLWLLPFAGLAIGAAYHYGGGRAVAGNNLILDEIHEPSAWVPRRMAPMVFGATVVTHLFGGSAGREGTAIQMSGSLADGFGRAVGLAPLDRRLVLVAAIAGGFGAVFGVPFAGCVFALEVQTVGRIRFAAVVPAVVASFVGDRIVRGLGVEHLPVPRIDGVDLSGSLLAKVALAGVAFGVTAGLFARTVHWLKRAFARSVAWPPMRPLVGGLLVIALTYVVDSRDYLGLSLPLISDSLVGTAAGVATFAFAGKLLFTVVTLGSGFHGGEVTPLFVIGATLGATLGDVLDAPVPVLAALGMVAVFGAAAKTPVACTIMGIELFGPSIAVPLAIACGVAFLCSGRHGIYTAQRRP